MQLLGQLFGNSSVDTNALVSYVEQKDTVSIATDLENLAKMWGKNSNHQWIIERWIAKLRDDQSISVELRRELMKAAMVANQHLSEELLNENLKELDRNINNITDVTKRNFRINTSPLKVISMPALFFCVAFVGYVYLIIQSTYDRFLVRKLNL